MLPRVWKQALPKLNNIWAGVSDPTEHIFALLDRLRAKRSVPQDILEAVARTDAAAIVDYPGRREIWALVPSGFLMRTARALFVCDQDPGELEEELLQEAILTLDENSPSSPVAQRLLLQT